MPQITYNNHFLDAPLLQRLVQTSAYESRVYRLFQDRPAAATRHRWFVLPLRVEVLAKRLV